MIIRIQKLKFSTNRSCAFALLALLIACLLIALISLKVQTQGQSLGPLCRFSPDLGLELFPKALIAFVLFLVVSPVYLPSSLSLTIMNGLGGALDLDRWWFILLYWMTFASLTFLFYRTRTIVVFILLSVMMTLSSVNWLIDFCSSFLV